MTLPEVEWPVPPVRPALSFRVRPAPEGDQDICLTAAEGRALLSYLYRLEVFQQQAQQRFELLQQQKRQLLELWRGGL